MEAGTLDRLAAYLDLLNRWQQRINLVGNSTLADPWRRHIHDSAQLLPYLPPSPAAIVDLGSGAGLPGLVLAIIGGFPVTLVDSDARKCAFLREAARITAAPVTVLNQRIETLPHASASVVTARALAPLARLLAPISTILRPSGVALLLKGRAVQEELTLADKHWKMSITARPSLSDPDGWVLKLQEIGPRHVP
jgi:16S rRNA (guanine(527)-N(7))-methyltransferase GidB